MEVVDPAAEGPPVVVRHDAALPVHHPLLGLRILRVVFVPEGQDDRAVFQSCQRARLLKVARDDAGLLPRPASVG